MTEKRENKGPTNIRLAIFLGLVAVGFFFLGLYLAGGGSGQ